MTAAQAKRISKAIDALRAMKDAYDAQARTAYLAKEDGRAATRLQVMAEETAHLIERYMIDVSVYDADADVQARAHAILFPDE